MRLFEVIQLNEYNRQATLSKWGERIAQAAKFNYLHMGDYELDSLGPIYDDKEFNVKVVGKVLDSLEQMDPTRNKKYVMTLVRWYTGVIKRDKELQGAYDRYFDSQPRERQYDMPDSYTEFDPNDGLPDDVGEYGNYEDPENMNTFKLEDSDQIKTALENFERIKPQLPANERDIGRFKSFYRFEDYVDSKMDPEDTQETESDVLKRKDVEVLYNGAMGTVTIPRTEEASCELGKGTRWCTAGNMSNMYDYYAQRGDLIIYNEKPGNAKYQFHIDINRIGSGRGIEATDARDRQLGYRELKYFQEEHPVMKEILKKQFVKMLNSNYQPTRGDAWRSIKNLLVLNREYGGGDKKYLDGYIVHQMKRVEKDKTSNTPEFLEQAVEYAQDRGKPWPAFEEMSITHLNRFFMSVMADKSRNSYLSGQGTKGDALMNLVRDNVIGPQGKTIKRYLEQLLKYKKSVNPGWKGIDNFVKAYQNAMSKDRDVLPPDNKR